VSTQFNVPEDLNFQEENYENLRSWKFITRVYLLPCSFCKYTQTLFRYRNIREYMSKILIDRHVTIMTECYQLPYFAELQFCKIWLDSCL